jgi:hypothetical protein
MNQSTCAAVSGTFMGNLAAVKQLGGHAFFSACSTALRFPALSIDSSHMHFGNGPLHRDAMT